MSIPLKQFGKDVFLTAGPSGLILTEFHAIDWSRPETWPPKHANKGRADEQLLKRHPCLRWDWPGSWKAGSNSV